MDSGVTFIVPLRPRDSIESGSAMRREEAVQGPSFKSIFNNVVEQVVETQAEVEQQQYLLATGQLDDAHSLPIAEAKAALSLEVLISLRNKAMESYSELMRMSI